MQITHEIIGRDLSDGYNIVYSVHEIEYKDKKGKTQFLATGKGIICTINLSQEDATGRRYIKLYLHCKALRDSGKLDGDYIYKAATEDSLKEIVYFDNEDMARRFMRMIQMPKTSRGQESE